jgi:hypothetical protein
VSAECPQDLYILWSARAGAVQLCGQRLLWLGSRRRLLDSNPTASIKFAGRPWSAMILWPSLFAGWHLACSLVTDHNCPCWLSKHVPLLRISLGSSLSAGCPVRRGPPTRSAWEPAFCNSLSPPVAPAMVMHLYQVVGRHLPVEKKDGSANWPCPSKSALSCLVCFVVVSEYPEARPQTGEPRLACAAHTAVTRSQKSQRSNSGRVGNPRTAQLPAARPHLAR